MKTNHKSIDSIINNKQRFSDDEVAGFERFEKKQRSLSSPSWKPTQKATRFAKEAFLNS